MAFVEEGLHGLLLLRELVLDLDENPVKEFKGTLIIISNNAMLSKGLFRVHLSSLGNEPVLDLDDNLDDVVVVLARVLLLHDQLGQVLEQKVFTGYTALLLHGVAELCECLELS